MGVSVTDFEFVRQLVHEHSSIAIADGKEYLVEARLAPVAEQEGLDSVGDLLRLLRNGTARVRDAVVHAMTTNETSFFRDRHPFDALRETVIPAVLATNGGRGLSMWSAAASTGQEAYSMALVVYEHFRHVPEVRILGTDLSTDVLARAARGRYTQLEVNRGLPASLLIKHFERDGLEWQLKPSIRNMVRFTPLNLARPLQGIRPMDVIFLRNVLIYFDAATKASVLTRIADALKPRGFLFLGSAETTIGISDRFARVQAGRTVCYQLKGPDADGHS